MLLVALLPVASLQQSHLDMPPLSSFFELKAACSQRPALLVSKF